MPIYKHTCTNCGYTETDLFKLSDPEPNCPKCGIKMTRELGRANFELHKK